MTALDPSPSAPPVSTADAVVAHLTERPTIGLRDLGKAVGRGRTATHRAVRELVKAGRVRVLIVGTCADLPSTYSVVSR